MQELFEGRKITKEPRLEADEKRSEARQHLGVWDQLASHHDAETMGRRSKAMLDFKKAARAEDISRLLIKQEDVLVGRMLVQKEEGVL